LYLAVSCDPSVVIDETMSKTTIAAENFPVAGLSREFYRRRPDFGEVARVGHSPGLRVGSDYGFWSLVVPSVDPSKPTLRFILSPEMGSMLIVGLWLAGLAAWYPLVGVSLWRMRRRQGRGHCPRCGYDVKAGRDEPAAVTSPSTP
jgi:hypothetical protein